MDRVRDLVASGGVSVVLAQDRDRFAREPAYHYLLRREFEEHGTKIRALNDRGDESPEGELTDGILDQLAKYERAKIVERSRRGKLRKAREGKVLAAYRPTHGFRMNAARDGYEVDEEKMAVVRRVFRMVGAEGAGIYGVHKTLEREGVPPPGGGRYWDKRAIKRWIVDDAYKPHAYEEVAELVRPEVAARLDPGRSYGIWWFNRRRTTGCCALKWWRTRTTNWRSAEPSRGRGWGIQTYYRCDRPPDRPRGWPLLRDQRQLGGHTSDLRHGAHPARRRCRGERGGVPGERFLYRTADNPQRSETTHTLSQHSVPC
jgi:DNA invertase Pin-like site-specific DNA recombinase